MGSENAQNPSENQPSEFDVKVQFGGESYEATHPATDTVGTVKNAALQALGEPQDGNITWNLQFDGSKVADGITLADLQHGQSTKLVFQLKKTVGGGTGGRSSSQ